MKWRSLEESLVVDDVRPLRDQLAERKQQIEKYVPESVRAVHARVVKELSESKMLDGVVAAGSQAPHFELMGQNGIITSSQKLLNLGPIVICFFRGRWCPFCVTQLEAMNRVFPHISAGGASLLAISPQTVHQNYLMADQHKLSFPLLSDPGNRVAREFGLAYQVLSEQQVLYRRSFVNLSFINGDESWELPIPASFVLDKQGIVQFASANPDYTERPEPEELIRFLRE
jgi:peroxiredoxin